MDVQKHTHAYPFLFLCFEKLAEFIFYYYELPFASLDPDALFCDLFVHDDEHMSEIFPVCLYAFSSSAYKEKKKKRKRKISHVKAGHDSIHN